MVALSAGGAHLGFFHPAALPRAPVVLLGAQGQGRQRGPLRLAELRLAAGPILGPFRTAVWGRQPEDAHGAVAFEPDGLALRADGALGSRPQGLPVGVDQAVALEAREPGPAADAHLLKVGQRGVLQLSNKTHQGGAKPRCWAARSNCWKWSFLVSSSVALS